MCNDESQIWVDCVKARTTKVGALTMDGLDPKNISTYYKQLQKLPIFLLLFVGVGWIRQDAVNVHKHEIL